MTARRGAAETVDVAIVGARCAGSATAIAFARAGLRTVMLDRASFPADTISTHLLWPGGVAELARLGALERVGALGAPPMTEAFAAGPGVSVQGGSARSTGSTTRFAFAGPGSTRLSSRRRRRRAPSCASGSESLI